MDFRRQFGRRDGPHPLSCLLSWLRGGGSVPPRRVGSLIAGADRGGIGRSRRCDGWLSPVVSPRQGRRHFHLHRFLSDYSDLGLGSPWIMVRVSALERRFLGFFAPQPLDPSERVAVSVLGR